MSLKCMSLALELWEILMFLKKMLKEMIEFLILS